MTTSHSIEDLNRQYKDAGTQDIVRDAIEHLFPERIALVSSFGTEAAVLLHLISRVDRATPVLFLDTLKHFDETLAYRDRLIDRLRLSDVRTIQPAASDIARTDPAGVLWAHDADACCDLRKTRPLDAEVMRFQALFTGRKRHHGQARSSLSLFEMDGEKIKINPLAGWDQKQVAAYFDKFGLPRHPLVEQGYPSVGCAVCTAHVPAGGDFRSGRWPGRQKTECGIHKINRSNG